MRDQEPDAQSLTGMVSQVGTSRGKTIAAWNGIPPPHPFLVIQREGDESAYAWFPHQPPEDMARLLGKRVRLTGRWVAPPEPEIEDIAQPIQQPIEQVRTMDILSMLSVELEDGLEDDDVAPGDPPQVTEKHIWVPVARRAHFQADHIVSLEEPGVGNSPASSS